jgi:hypothetical protein
MDKSLGKKQVVSIAGFDMWDSPTITSNYNLALQAAQYDFPFSLR